MRDRRRALGIRTQQQLADQVGVDRTHIAKIESGAIVLPQPELRRRLADVLGVSERDFLVAAGVLAEEPTTYRADDASDEYRLRHLMLDLSSEDRSLLVEFAALLQRRRRAKEHEQE